MITRFTIRLRGSLLAIMQDVQDEANYLPREAVEHISKKLEVPVARIYSMATFFESFHLEPRGKHICTVCMGTACYLQGGEDIIMELEGILGVGVNTVTPDGEFSVEAVRCIGCCGLAPVMVVNGEVYGKVETKDMHGIVAEIRKG